MLALPPRRDRGASALEYVLLLSLVALAAAAALGALGLATHGPASSVRDVTVQLHAGDAVPSQHDWCTSDSSGCVATVAVGSTSTIHFWAAGGQPPYDYALAGAPSFVHLGSLDSVGGTGEITIGPATCSQRGRFGGIRLTVSASAGSVDAGIMRFSVVVAPGSSC